MTTTMDLEKANSFKLLINVGKGAVVMFRSILLLGWQAIAICMFVKYLCMKKSQSPTCESIFSICRGAPLRSPVARRAGARPCPYRQIIEKTLSKHKSRNSFQ